MGRNDLLFGIDADDNTRPIFAGVAANAKSWARSMQATIAAPFKAMTSMSTFAAVQNFKTLGSMASGFTELFATQQRAELKLGQVLESTGHAAGFTLKQLKDQASAWQDSTTFGDETILNAQALISTFKE